MPSTPNRNRPEPAPAAHDVSEHLDDLQEKLSDLQKQLRHAQRLASIGTMATMVAHEYNNLMTPIISFSRYALEQDDPELLRSAVQKSLRQAEQAQQLSAKILSLAVDQDRGPTRVELRELIGESVECLGRKLEKDNIGVTIDVPENLWVRAHPGQLQQVLVNLIQNARQAMLGRRGRLTFRAESVDDQVVLSVSDTGEGIGSEDLPRIFDPFFTTKGMVDRPDRRGIGLGLAVCKDIVEEQGGRIDVESKLGAGATFTITLPVA